MLLVRADGIQVTRNPCACYQLARERPGPTGHGRTGRRATWIPLLPARTPGAGYYSEMRFHTYSKFSAELADAVDLESLLDKLADFLLQSGFAGGPAQHPYWGDIGEDADRSLGALKQAILNALMQGGQFTPEMLQALRGDGDEQPQASLDKLLHHIVHRRDGQRSQH